MYALKEGELVKVIPRADQPKARRDFTRDRDPAKFAGLKGDELEKELDAQTAEMICVATVNGQGKFEYVQETGGITMVPQNAPRKYLGVGILGLPHYLGRFQSFEISFDPALNDSQFMDNPDFVVRRDAPRDKLIPALDKALREQLKVKFTLELESVEREVWVASGKVAVTPRTWRKAGQVDVYSDEANVNKESFSHAHNLTPGYETGDVKQLLAQIQDTVGTWVMWTDDAPPKSKFDWTYQWLKPNVAWEERQADRDPDKVLKNVAEQTGLTIKKGKRKVPVLFIRPLK